ncbi:MAG: 23S rRNA (uracil-5-)-methyltransferase RumA [Candidatus Edwardsbacteria bacterium RIFOXYD12_FULL_50_11]|uniref:23S rRNA (Uracil-5-)-methyltransferase RumA n=1 Tax=Candidatus Edwardsbacteria bacterium GWF2_54_11 TaxID=1817851 RepID=A0A1F5RE55_9BACT|nr:MAG: 23S rRNA (uracil-5-)-methyltransferase RumA [Candidatus Edwardsbacteria bacterium RifOxyC12_full_54_24]OGF08235.1 MAG: 23S rRNA (uracil-5-)-methyltransferase RumA [Candidatus Edwardsbacteria bacterium RifOxyA12_full_54_48]OGF11532.1 MAG: 23S rRNA (uracil-5-)-methyltransferase RumA [Candidatus Edwardsbacteria bacterium GWE2_54_12]OGF12737.1 MAG: 23S rRNA (uracil-5-)-methyltransferase RumA [Candidatus Edwardsbacteria bacterium GWF2_54_11]OGF14834.1 MAG: 23S rRNA (uracil-5-)-methyltransfer
MLRAGQVLNISLENLAYGGDAVGHHQGQAVFVPYGVPGDELKVKIIEPHKTYSRGEVHEIIKPSDHRVKPACRHFGICGSCQWQMMDYQYQLEQKTNITREIFKRLGKIEIDEIAVLPPAGEWHYRNKAQYPVQASKNGNGMGYYRLKSHDLVDIQECPLLEEPITQAFRKVKEVINKSGLKGSTPAGHSGNLRHLILRYSKSEEALSLVLVTRYEPDLHKIAQRILAEVPNIKSVWQNVNPARGNVILGKKWTHLGGVEYLSERIGHITCRLSPGSFLQSNLRTSEMAYQNIKESLQLSPGDEVADLYSGMGSIALQLAGQAKRVTAIEEFAPAVDDARVNAALNNIGNCEFLCGRAEDQLIKLKSADALVLDPPRQGAAPGVIEAIAGLNPARIAYLSCNPSTLARDAALLVGRGYKLQKLFLADMFPQTYHIENLAILTR